MDAGPPLSLTLPIRAGHTYTHVTGHDSARVHLGDNIKISTKVVVIGLYDTASDKNLPDVHNAEQPEFAGHYSSTALRKVASYVPRPGLHEQIKERLHDTLEERGRSCKILVICGLGGAGKSQLTLNYIEEFKSDYTAVFWIDAGSKDRLEADYMRIHNLLLQPSRDDADINKYVSEVRQWCQRNNGRYLFVLDSADDIDDSESDGYIDLQSYLVDSASADVVITTRVQSAKDMTDLEALQVAELTPDEAREIFIRRMNLQSLSPELQGEIDAVTAELGHFALAVSLAAAYVTSTRRLKAHPANYLVEYAERKKTLLARRPKKHIDQYGESVLSTWETTYAAIFSRCPEACNLLTFMAFFSSSDIFPELFGSGYREASDILAEVICVQASTSSLRETIDNSIEILELYSLLQWNGQSTAHSMHKLVHTWSVERLDTTERSMFCTAGWEYLSWLCPIAETIPGMSERLVAHVTACFIRVKAMCHAEHLATNSLLKSTVYLARDLNLIRQAEYAYEMQAFAHRFYERRRSIDPLAYAKSLLALSQILTDQYKREAAEALLRQALDELKEPLSTEGRLIQESCERTLATLLAHAHKKYSEAEQMLRQILLRPGCMRTQRENVTYRLAGVLAMQGRDIEAEEELRQLLNGDVEIPSQDRIRYVRDLSKALRRQGKYTEADDVMQPAVQDALVYGVADLRSQIASLELGKVKLHQKAYGEAVSVLRPACNAIPNPYHQAHLECLEHLGYALKHLKCYNESMLFYTRALDGNLRMYGADHPFTRETSAKIDDYRAFLAGRTNSEEQHGQDSGVCTAVQGEITSGSLGSEPS